MLKLIHAKRGVMSVQLKITGIQGLYYPSTCKCTSFPVGKLSFMHDTFREMH